MLGDFPLADPPDPRPSPRVGRGGEGRGVAVMMASNVSYQDFMLSPSVRAHAPPWDSRSCLSHKKNDVTYSLSDAANPQCVRARRLFPHARFPRCLSPSHTRDVPRPPPACPPFAPPVVFPGSLQAIRPYKGQVTPRSCAPRP